MIKMIVVLVDRSEGFENIDIGSCSSLAWPGMAHNQAKRDKKTFLNDRAAILNR